MEAAVEKVTETPEHENAEATREALTKALERIETLENRPRPRQSLPGQETEVGKAKELAASFDNLFRGAR